MESAVACRAAPEQGKDAFVNKTRLYKPLWGRGAFGGAVLAQALSAAQATVPVGFVADTMHCHFFVAVRTDEPLYSHVERLRDGKSIATRSVRCVQLGKCVFSAILNFGRATGRGPRMLEHQPESPVSAATLESIRRGALSSTSQVDPDCPFESMRVRATHDDEHKRYEQQRIVQMTKAKFSSSSSSSQQQDAGGAGEAALHQAALAYMTDNYFLGTVPRVHKAQRFSNKKLVKSVVEKMDARQRQTATERFDVLAKEELADAASRTAKGGAVHANKPSPRIEMMVSLDHTIFFHNQESVRADDWMVMEMETPWAGQDRGLVLERIWTADGVLVATCIQEGLFRLSQDPEAHL
ncbi:acyl-CoA thioesterase II [Cordyceps javanica]|uniref:Acyl-CoA thioesterase II n=1 Tax=Cordyceps javanica TaxID=43265 RepID=A0A545VNR0_9HYPO|nr:acyl-CoA thioesterase II [Cordyceps javanica]TQW03370.1 acyl-CoA thioesterase II [Cordyceps javanica]